ncbi:non-ribosomal peptide synthetase, partial [Solihabitans fulvus]
RAIIDAAARHKTVLLQTVPSMLDMILDTITPHDHTTLTHLRNTVSSGEALHPNTITRYHNTMPGTLHNTWGATEVSIDSTIHTCTHHDTTDTGPTAIGKPFDNNQIHILDHHLNPVPLGTTGNLYIAGTGLARGYLHNPTKTAQTFLPNPFQPGQRMYNTGDQGYQRPDGTLKYTGRNDHQIKIRGMRVELGEIDTTLHNHPTIKNAITTHHQAPNGLKRLISYVTPADLDVTVSPDDVRAYVGDHLPDYMTPSLVIVLDRLPLNANGKVDRLRLPEPTDPGALTGTEFVAPTGPAQQAVVAIWADLLGTNRIGAQDNFFHLGGHSLLAAKFTARVRSRFGVELPLQVVFTSPTVRALASELESLLEARIRDLSEDEALALLRELA